MNTQSTNDFDYSPIPIELRELVDNELDAGETVKWIDQPVTCLCNKEVLPIFLFTIIWLIFILNILLFVKIKSFSEFLSLMLVIIIGIGLLLVPFWKYKKMLQIVYVITNRRVIVLEKKTFSLDITSYDIEEELDEFHPKQEKNGIGDIFVFQHIRNVKYVEQKLHELKKLSKTK
jgi:hypothetical protein